MLAPVSFPMQVPLEKGWAALPGGAMADLVTTKVAEAHARPLPHWKKKILVATRGNPRLLKFAFEHAKSQQAEILLLFIRHVSVETGGAREEDLAVDGEALAMQAIADRPEKDYGVPCHFLYTTATDVAESLLDIAVTHGVETVVIGVSRRGGLWRAMKGDVIESRGHLLPESIWLLISTSVVASRMQSGLA